jgi:chemotaxis methyl-accepting protein methylase
VLGVAWRCLQPRVRLLGRGLPVVQEMRRLSVWRRGADVGQEAASLALLCLGADGAGNGGGAR